MRVDHRRSPLARAAARRGSSRAGVAELEIAASVVEDGQELEELEPAAVAEMLQAYNSAMQLECIEL